MINMSESIAALAAALVKAQGEMKPATKDSTNPHFKSRYADLASVIEASRAPLAGNGLAISQHVDLDGDTVGVTTLLIHSSGEWISSRAGAVVGKRDPQSVGSAVTYLRRYGWQAAIGLAAEDDDGEAATVRREPHAARTMVVSGRQLPPDPATTPTTSLVAKLRVLCAETKTEVSAVAAAYSVEGLDDLTHDQLAEAIGKLVAYKNKRS